ncbi:hypothetical protein GUJ93_ZPchr0014g47241 [Zizania palustris]|uniref:Uncharacterized protein n=1 Tax=Zizania palustris TaxID=103762 RepID=A0A8J5SWB8_ZIZPA|nr:hypothetical protein GUJ93_ZPchr0014g47241 [Zizania palustris]
MFHSNHESSEFHGAARALSGAGVYVSDRPGVHNFNILKKKLVLTDRLVLRVKYAGRPTRDPVIDGKGSLSRLQKHHSLEVSFDRKTCDIYSMSPIKKNKRLSLSWYTLRRLEIAWTNGLCKNPRTLLLF